MDRLATSLHAQRSREHGTRVSGIRSGFVTIANDLGNRQTRGDRPDLQATKARSGTTAMTRPIDQRPDGSPPSPAPEAIEARRTARRFDPDRPLPDALLARLIELATLAPSPCNLQPWRFLVVRDPRNRRRLRSCTYGDTRLTEAPVVLVVLAYRHPDRTDLGAVVERQLALGAISPENAARVRATAARTWSRIPDPTRPAIMASAALMIAAESLGLASAWIDEIIEEEVRRNFGIPDDHALGGLLALGFAAEETPFPGRLGARSGLLRGILRAVLEGSRDFWWCPVLSPSS